jgi:predicted deacylase
MLLGSRTLALVLVLMVWGCVGGEEASFHHRSVVRVPGPAVDARALDAPPPLTDTAFPIEDGGLDQNEDGGGLADRPSVDASDSAEAKQDAVEVRTSDVEPSDAKPLPDAGCALLDNIPGNLPNIGFSEYHTLAQMLSYLQAVAGAAPTLAQYRVLGTSKQGRDLGYLVLNATCQASPPAIFYNGAHHGDEDASAEAVLALPDYLLRRGASDTSVRGLLQTYAFAILPVVNPDGLAVGSRFNADGDDINRDYPYPGRGESDSFKTREGLLIKSLQESLVFAGAVAFHSGAEEVLWPWCYTGTGTDDESFFLAAGKKTAAAMGISIYQQSYDDYPTTGEYIDYAYAKSRTLAATFEVSTIKHPSPSVLASVVERAARGAIAWAQAVSDRALGRLHALPAGPRPRFPFTAPFDGRDRLE